MPTTNQMIQKLKDRITIKKKLMSEIKEAEYFKKITTQTAQALLNSFQFSDHLSTIKAARNKFDKLILKRARTFSELAAIQQKVRQTLNRHRNEKTGRKKNYSIRLLLFFRVVVQNGVKIKRKPQSRFQRINGIDYEVNLLRVNVKATKNIFKLGSKIGDANHRNIFNSEGSSVEERTKYSIGIEILLTNDYIARVLQSEYPEGFRIFDIEEGEKGENDPFDTESENEMENVLNVPLRSVECSLINNRFVSNRVDVKGKDVVAAATYNKNFECFINALLNVYGGEKVHFSTMTRKNILKILNKTEEQIIHGITINEMVKVFDHYNLPVKIYDSYHKVIYSRVSKTHIRTFYALVKDKHLYVMDYEVPKIAYYPEFNTQDDLLQVSSTFKLKQEEIPTFNFKTITTYQDVKSYVVEYKESLKKKQKENNKDEQAKKEMNEHVVHNLILCNNSLYELYAEARHNKYDPVPCYNNHEITKLIFKFEGLIMIVQSVESLFVSSDVPDSCPEVDYDKLNLLATEHHKFTTSVFNRKTISEYDNDDERMFTSCSTKAQQFWIKECSEEDEIVEIDRRRSYTATFKSIKEVPVFNIFDNWTPYDGHDVEDLTEYYVSGVNNEFFLNTYNRVFGFILKNFKGNTIHAFKRPANINQVHYSELVDEFYKYKYSDCEELDALIKKKIVNIEIGKLEMTNNKKSVCSIFTTKEEAIRAQLHYGGIIEKLDEGFNSVEGVFYKSPLDNGIEDAGEICAHQTVFNPAPEGKTYYVHFIENKKRLNNGFKFIKELVLQKHNYDIYKDIKKLQENNIDVFSVKTDALTIRKKDLEAAKKLLNFGDDIGCWRFFKEKEAVNMPPYKYSVNKNFKQEFVKPELITKTFEDEYDTKLITDYILEHKKMMVRARYPGSGKSYLGLHLKALMNTPSNKLSQEFMLNDCEASTINRFFGVGVNPSTDQIAKCDDSQSVINFDEINFLDVGFLTRIKRYVDAHPEKVHMGTGDNRQLENFNIMCNNIKDKKAYLDECINKIFGYHEIKLNVSKRLKNPEDRKKLENIEKLIFESDLSTVEIAKELMTKYFNTTSRINTSKAVCYFNETCKAVNAAYRKSKGYTEEYLIKEHIVCKHYLRLKKIKYNVNYEYVITGKTDTTIKFKDITDNSVEFELGIPTMRKHFDYAYATTCHSFQGSSTSEKITIYDWKCNFITKEWLWVAITRARDLNNVMFYTGKALHTESFVKSVLKRKVEGYLDQDMKAKRFITNNFITVDVLKSFLTNKCYLCNENLTLDNLTADRFDNDLCHSIDNCRPCCFTCNVSRSNHY